MYVHLDLSLAAVATDQIQKLEALLQLPPAFLLQKSKVLLLRVTIPIDFYNSPITAEVDGVDIQLKVDEPDRAKPETAAPETTVPNTVDLAQSFLDTESPAERRKMEDALHAGASDLEASISMSDDGSEDVPGMGTGQPLTLPLFLAQFLQGILDRMQVKIKGVAFQIHTEIPAELGSSRLEPISLQVTLDTIDIEGVTTSTGGDESTSNIVPKEGKRHVSLEKIRAYILSEANIFPALSRASSMQSPSTASSPIIARDMPSREASDIASLATERIHGQYTGSHPAGGSLASSVTSQGLPAAGDDGQYLDDAPPTPRASVYHDFFTSEASESDEEPAFSLANSRLMMSSQLSDRASSSNMLRERELPFRSVTSEATADAASSSALGQSQIGLQAQNEDMETSRVYTHEEAESMYMSAFSHSSEQPQEAQVASTANNIDLPLAEDSVQTPENMSSKQTESAADIQIEPISSPPSKFSMPGAWGEDSIFPTPTVTEAVASSTPTEATSTPHLETESQADAILSSIDARLTAATPKPTTRVAKKILEFDQLSIYLPSMHAHPDTNMAHAVDDAAAVLESASVGKTAGEQTPAPDAGGLEIFMSPATVNFDPSISFLLYTIVTKLIKATDSTGAQKAKQPSKAKNDTSARPLPMTFSLKQLSINFLNHLGGVAEGPDVRLDSSAHDFRREVLLRLNITDLTVLRTTDDPKDGKPVLNETKIELKRLNFGYSKDDIIYFDAGRPITTSVRDTFLSSGHDIAIKILESSQGTRTEVETLPLVFQLELQRLDETFGWFGGLSGFLHMSASMTSNTATARQPAPSQQKPRSVRFDAPIKPEDTSASSSNKLNVRIGGTYVELVGRDCSFSSESNALKIVSRDEGIGIACSLLRISGPHLNNSVADPAINAEIAGLRLEFLNTPKTTDLEKLLELIIPSKVKYDHTTDEIMVDTLLRQRRQGSVLRATVDSVSFRVKNINQLQVLPQLAEELAKLSTVAKYLPEDDRPGLLTLAKIHRLTGHVDAGDQFGSFSAECTDAEVGHISLPSLVAVAVEAVLVSRNKVELIKPTPFTPSRDAASRGPVFMARMIGDEIEPTIKLKLRNLLVEYRVDALMDLLGLGKDATPQDFDDSLSASVANLGDQTQIALARSNSSPTQSSKPAKPMRVDISMSDCLIGLNPLHLPSKLFICLTDSQLEITLPRADEMKATFNINKASLLLIDDAARATEGTGGLSSRPPQSAASSTAAIYLCTIGYVDICYISSAMIVVTAAPGEDGERQMSVNVRDDLLVLETCADSTQTLITLANGLKPPTPPSKENKYRTNVVPMEDLLASISAEAFGKSEGEYDFDQDFAGAQEMAGSSSDVDGSEGSFRIDSQYYGTESVGEELFDATKSATLSHTGMEETSEGVLLTGFEPEASQGSVDSEDLVIHDNFYGNEATRNQVAKVWNSSKNTYDDAASDLVKRSPVMVSVRDVHVIWNLFDGYDWQHTRDVISKAVQEVENKAFERQSRTMTAQLEEEDMNDGEAIGDFLFNSIYIGIPANRDPQELSRAINDELNDAATETESVATTAVTTTSTRTVRQHRPKSKRLQLSRSRHHKITFELQGINADLFVYPPGNGETDSSIDVRVRTLDVFDHVPTSTWKKFATYDQDRGEREMGTSMVHLEILNVKPIPELAASEIVLRATLLPLRLHVDQDALDFITRFFEFKDDHVPVHASPSDIPFVQRAEINSVPVKLDFKPKRVDYVGLRSGHTTEFMNFIVLEESRMVLRHVIIYGVSGFDRLGKTLNDIWTPDVRTNQLPGVIAGLAPVRSIVNIGSGFKDLIEIPIREYQKDGRVMRSISKGATAFARTTGTEIVKLGAKLAVGTQYALLGAEDMLTERRPSDGAWDECETPEEEKKQISLYADQPTGVIQGVRGGYRSLARDVIVARDAIIAVPGEVMQNPSAAGVAKVMLKRAPTIIFRPAVGVTNAIGQTLMGATNAMDPHNKRRINEVREFKSETTAVAHLTFFFF